MYFSSTERQTFTYGGSFSQRLLPVLTLTITTFLIPAPAHALVINASYDEGSLSAAAQAVINTAIGFYQNTFSDAITVNIDFHNMTSGLGSSLTPLYFVPYATYRSALITDATSANDTAALASLPANNGKDPILDKTNIWLKPADGQAVGLSTSGVTLTSGDTSGFCSGSNLDGCIGLNISNTTTAGGSYSLLSTVEHEIDEVLGLGSSLSGDGTILGSSFGSPYSSGISPEDLFRYTSAGSRSFALNATCPGSNAYFSINQGNTLLDQFNNCTNGGDYGDWVTHTPSQVQDAFTNGSSSSGLKANSAEVVALDVIGYTLKQHTTVPEPADAMLFSAGFAGMFMTRRRSQLKKASRLNC